MSRLEVEPEIREEDAEVVASAKRNDLRKVPGQFVYRFIILSFGLLCILQAALNISLRLTLLTDFSTKQLTSFCPSVYYISSTMETWKNSREDCLSRGADLVIITSEAEQAFLTQFKSPIWIGLSDVETEGTWKWVDGTPLTTSYWHTNEPNSYEDKEEDCAEVRFHDTVNNWNDKPCDLKNFWICERKRE